jgi:hypothetical protein
VSSPPSPSRSSAGANRWPNTGQKLVKMGQLLVKYLNLVCRYKGFVFISGQILVKSSRSGQKNRPSRFLRSRRAICERQQTRWIQIVKFLHSARITTGPRLSLQSSSSPRGSRGGRAVVEYWSNTGQMTCSPAAAGRRSSRDR